MQEQQYPGLESCAHLSKEQFENKYLGKQSVVLKNFITKWPAVKKWSNEYLISECGHFPVNIKVGKPKNKLYTAKSIVEYVSFLESHDTMSNHAPRYYLHDFQMLERFPQLISDIIFPREYISEWYHYKWWRNMLFFWGAKGATSSLHFDVLCTHNFFFHIRGRKRFIIIKPEYIDYCYLNGFNHFAVDPLNVNLQDFPLFARAHAHEVVLEPGDALYMPPFTLHHVQNLTQSLSCNIDWHTGVSINNAILYQQKHKKYSWMKYNLLCKIGISMGISAKYLYPLYKGYFTDL